jgi:NADH dehydrogenase
VAFFGVPGAAEHALPLYTLDGARRVRNEVLTALEQAERAPSGAAAIVVVGGGPTGVETAGALSELIDIVVRHDRVRLDPRRSHVVLLDARHRLLAGFTPRAGLYAEQMLRSRGVEVRLGAAVQSVSQTGVVLADGDEIPAMVVVWVAGVSVERTLASSLPGTRAANGRVVVEPDLSLPGHPEVFVAGDAGAISSPAARLSSEAPPTGTASRLAPQVAQAAIQSGDHAARQILNRIGHRSTDAFAYRDRGMMATVGRRAAVAQLHSGLVVRGTMGWAAWLALHLFYLIGFRNRAVVLVNWAWRYFRWPSGPRLIIKDLDSDIRSGGAAPSPQDPGRAPIASGPRRQRPGQRHPTVPRHGWRSAG